MKQACSLPGSIEEFYAHALGLEHECEQCLTDLSLTLEAHHNPEAAKVFAQAEQIQQRSIQVIRQLSEGLDIPRVAPWEYLWHPYINFDSICMASVHYLITPYEAIELVQLKLEAVSEFYRDIGSRSMDLAIQQAAAQIRSLLKIEIDIVKGWRRQHEELSRLPDLDPPHQPE